MPKILLTSFGKIKVAGLRETADHYLKMLSHSVEIEEIELKASKLDGRSEAKRKQAQLEDQTTLIDRLERDRQAYQLWLLDESGRTHNSQSWAKLLNQFKETSNTRTVIAVGSAQGWSVDFKKSARGLLSFGPQTLAHDLARVVLLEQLYRASALLAGHPYHIEN